MTYAKTTNVSVAQSRAEIERLVTVRGARSFATGWESGAISVLFEMRDRRVRFYLPLPQPDDKQFALDGNRRPRTKEARVRAHEQAIRARWRALLLVIKAKLEAVESGVATFEQEFLANIIVPGGGTVGEWALPLLDEAYTSGAPLPPMLGSGGRR